MAPKNPQKKNNTDKANYLNKRKKSKTKMPIE